MMKFTINMKYDKNNNLVFRSTDRIKCIFKYDKNNNLISYKEIENDDKIIEEYYSEFDDKNNLIHHKDIENMNEYWCKYDIYNRLIEKYDTEGSIVYKYDEYNNITEMIDTVSNIPIKSYINIYDINEVINLDLVKDSDVYIIRKYDSNNNILEEISSFYFIKNEYDENNNLIHHTDNSHHNEIYKYDDNNNLIYKENKDEIWGYWNTYFNNKEIISCDRVGNIFSYQYDNHGNILYEIDKFGNILVEYINEYEE